MNIGGHMARHIEGLYEITKEFERIIMRRNVIIDWQICAIQ